MEATKEIKIILYVLVVMMGMLMGFTFGRLNSIEDKIEAIAMNNSDVGRYVVYKATTLDGRVNNSTMIDTKTGELWSFAFQGGMEWEKINNPPTKISNYLNWIKRPS